MVGLRPSPAGRVTRPVREKGMEIEFARSASIRVRDGARTSSSGLCPPATAARPVKQSHTSANTNLKAGADTSTYQRWAAELQQYADATSDPNVAPHLRRIADQAAHAAGLIGLARAIPGDGTSPTQADIGRGFALNMTDIVDAENLLLDACNLR
jgi:hypothetical protein